MVIFRNKVLLLYRNQNGRHIGWVLPKGTLEEGETYKAAAVREVLEESGVTARVRKFIDKTTYSFYATDINTENSRRVVRAEPQLRKEKVTKSVYWYLMSTDSFKCRPQAEEHFADAGFYKQHEAYYLLKFQDERLIMTKAFAEYGKKQKTYKPIREDGTTHEKSLQL